MRHHFETLSIKPGICGCLLVEPAMRDLFTSMEQAGGSFPPIMMLNVLHMCFPQFAEKNDQGIFQQQVSSYVTTQCGLNQQKT